MYLQKPKFGTFCLVPVHSLVSNSKSVCFHFATSFDLSVGLGIYYPGLSFGSVLQATNRRAAAELLLSGSKYLNAAS